MSEYVAPRPTPTSEIWSYLKTGQYDKAVDEIRECGKSFNVNYPDRVSSLVPLHIASAAGHLELVVELLSQGALISAVDGNGNNSLHLAALNNHKGVVEVLLRSGADPSVPNGNGVLPVELTTNKFVRELFFRDQMSIFSPVVQAHGLFKEYLAQSNNFDKVLQPVRLEDEFNSSSHSDKCVNSFTNKFPVDSAVVAPTTPMKSSEQNGQRMFMSPSLLQAQKSAAATPSLPYSFNFSGVPSSKKKPVSGKKRPNAINHGTSFMSPSQIRDVMEQSYDGLPSESEELQQAVLQAAAETALVAQISSSDYNRRYELVRQIQDKKIESMKKALEQDPTLTICRLSDMGALITDGFTPFHVAAQYDNVEALKLLLKYSEELPRDLYSDISGVHGYFMVCWLRDLQGRTPLHIAAMNNAVAAAKWLRDEMRRERNNLILGGKDTSHFDLTELNSEETGQDEHSASGKGVRWSPSINNSNERGDTGNLSPNDPVGPNAPIDLCGLTPLGCGKVAASKRRANPLSTDMQQTLFSPGDRSVLPRTPKAGKLGAANQNKMATPSIFASPTLLRYQYHYALSGSKSGGSSEETSGKIRASYSADLPPPTDVNFCVDGSVASEKLNGANVALVYAVSEAQGWTNGMEDRHFCVCPLSSHLTRELSSSVYSMPTNNGGIQPDTEPLWKSWSFYGVLDGHGGSFSSDFLARCLPNTLWDKLQSSVKAQQSTNDAVEDVTSLLEDVCRAADSALASEKRMVVTKHPKNDQVAAMDTSGSTGILLLVTQSLLAVANVGDCRAVLARHVTQGDSNGTIESIELSRDHKPSLVEEKKRIEATGLTVEPVMGNDSVFEIADEKRCKGHKLRVSRAFGDFFFKQYFATSKTCVYDNDDDDLWRRQAVTACPEIRILSRDFTTDLFVVLACDGVWDVMTSSEVVDFISNHLRSQQSNPNNVSTTTETQRDKNWPQFVNEENVASACDSLLAECLKRGSRDNMTVFLVVFQPQPKQQSTKELQTAVNSDRGLLPFENPALLVHSASHNSSVSIHDINISNSSSRARSVSPRLQPTHYHTDHILPLPTPSMSSNSSRNSSPRASKVSAEVVGAINADRRHSFVRDPALCEVDVPQPPASVLLYTKQSGHTSSPLRGISESSPVSQQYPSTPPPPPLSDGVEPGIMSPLCSAPRSGLRTNNGSNSRKDRNSFRQEEEELVVSEDGKEGEIDVDVSEISSQVQRQLRF